MKSIWLPKSCLQEFFNCINLKLGLKTAYGIWTVFEGKVRGHITQNWFRRFSIGNKSFENTFHKKLTDEDKDLMKAKTNLLKK